MTVILLMIAVLVAVAGVLLALRRKSAVAGPEIAVSGPVFLFRDADLIDMTPDAQQMIAAFEHMPDRDAVLHVLGQDFPDLVDHLARTDQISRQFVHHTDPTSSVMLDWPNGQMRLAVQGGNRAYPTVTDGELALLRDVAKFSPQLIWHTDRDGVVVWVNQAYRDFWTQLYPQDTSDIADMVLFPQIRDVTDPMVRRIAVPLPQQGAENWFDVFTINQKDKALHFATDANAMVRADHDRQTFVQALGKTFADLSIGLAIFDKRRQLVTFNPALLDMTRLGFEFLSTRPTIDTVLDRLRETRILPEPKNYATWRDRFTAVETAAKNGTYSEVWNLPDGQALRVTGRPHPDGAFAFVFEDITADLSLTRRFRSDIEAGQAVLDALPDAVAVFSTAGTLVMYNKAYMALWTTGRDNGLEHRSFKAELAGWQNLCATAPDWEELQHYVHLLGPRQPWADDALLADGRLVRCHANPVAGGMTMVRFAVSPRVMPVLRKLTQADRAIRATKR